MTLQSFNRVFAWPGIVEFLDSTPSMGGGQTLDAAAEYYAQVFMARQSMTISHVGFLVNTATGSPTVDIRIETVAATGLPSGTLFNTNTNIVTSALTGSAWTLQALTASASVQRGDLVAVKVLYNSGTLLSTRVVGQFRANTQGLPYQVVNAGTPTKARGDHPLMAIGSGASSFYNVKGLWPITAFNNNTFNNTSSARRGLLFQVPVKCRAVGLRHWNGTSTGDFNIGIWDDGGSELNNSITAIDGDKMANLASGFQDLMFDSPVTLEANTNYRAALEPSSATNISLMTFTLPSADYRSAMPGGTNCFYTTYVASSWTDTATDQVPLLDVLIDQWDDGASSGGVTARVIGG
jgi:hypothetical protein